MRLHLIPGLCVCVCRVLFTEKSLSFLGEIQTGKWFRHVYYEGIDLCCSVIDSCQNHFNFAGHCTRTAPFWTCNSDKDREGYLKVQYKVLQLLLGSALGFSFRYKSCVVCISQTDGLQAFPTASRELLFHSPESEPPTPLLPSPRPESATVVPTDSPWQVSIDRQRNYCTRKLISNSSLT